VSMYICVSLCVYINTRIELNRIVNIVANWLFFNLEMV